VAEATVAVLVEPEWVAVEWAEAAWVAEATVEPVCPRLLLLVVYLLLGLELVVALAPMLGGIGMVLPIGVFVLVVEHGGVVGQLFAPMVSGGVEILLGKVAGDGTTDRGDGTTDRGDGIMGGAGTTDRGVGVDGDGMGTGTRISISDMLRLIGQLIRAVPARRNRNTEPATGGRLKP